MAFCRFDGFPVNPRASDGGLEFSEDDSTYIPCAETFRRSILSQTRALPRGVMKRRFKAQVAASVELSVRW